MKWARHIAIAGLIAASFVAASSFAASKPLPTWLTKIMAQKQSRGSRDVIEESTYDGKRVFEIISGERFDTGDEHILFTEGGVEMCKFGGFAGHVTSGSCDIQKIDYVRRVFPLTQ